MSMQASFAAQIPEETRRLVGRLLRADAVYRLVGNEIDKVISDGVSSTCMLPGDVDSEVPGPQAPQLDDDLCPRSR